jgi:hypothetical protein
MILTVSLFTPSPSLLQQKIIGGLRDKFAKIAEDKGHPDGREEADNQIFTCAPTGVAALLCGGITMHSLLGCGVPTVKDDFSKMDSRKIREKWLNMKVLVGFVPGYSIVSHFAKSNNELKHDLCLPT